MGKTLRVGFAMGGGNSLGTFNGSAISQALKLLLLRGIDREGDPYDRVEVDVFSGASAGSMSLALMLRSLVHPDGDRWETAKGRLKGAFGVEFTKKPKRVKKDLIAAQILQDVQEEVWVREMDLEKLLGLGSKEAGLRMRSTAGFFDRGAVESLARKYLAFPTRIPGSSEFSTDLSGRRILAERVLFASSIANLTPMLADASTEFPTDELGLLGLSDGMTSQVHRELRVFDLHFTEVPTETLTNPDVFPRRWCRYHAGPKVRDRHGNGHGIGSLFEPRVWGKIAATSVASGAFPLAFEPVPLERSAYEFGETEGGDLSRWPKTLKGRRRHVFTYVDGGTFNNEPVREAFRLASFIDAQAPEEDYERLILFVDPHVVVPDPGLELTHHAHWAFDHPEGFLDSVRGDAVVRRSSLDRLIPLTRALFRAITNESRVVEADKVFRTRRRFRIQNLIREGLLGALSLDPDPSALDALAGQLRHLLEIDRTGSMIPAGAVNLEGELRRVIAEESGPDHSLSLLRDKSPEEIRSFCDTPGSASAEEEGAWLRALAFVAVDRVMDLEGKMERSQLVAISPATDPSDPGGFEELPGRFANGFGGFMSELAGEHEVEVARYCTQLFLQAAGRVKRKKLPPRPDFSPLRPRYMKEVRKG